VLDDEIGKAFTRSLKKQGIKFRLSTKVMSGKVVGGKAELTVEPVKGGAAETLTSDVCLVAIGRKPYTSGLGAEKAGILINKKGQIEINDHF
jgi:dihydrolipoamide dehydrogenase